jgi:hypothetical protein
MNRTYVESSNIASVGYDAESLTLEVEFKKGAVYQYYDVPSSTYDEFLASPSKGTYLNDSVKKQFRCSKL